jgi:mono/diheme cytochrome c family protein
MSRYLLALLIATMPGYLFPNLVVAADDGAKIYQESCLSCHTAKMRPLEKMNLTREQWTVAIDRMIEQGAEVPKGKMTQLLDYLSRTNGPAAPPTEKDKK